MIAIVDYGAANLLSITRALETCGASVAVTDDPQVVAVASGVVLPGVGAAGAAMERLRAGGLDAALRDVVASARPLIGLCLGMQLFFDWLEEGEVAGLGLLPGKVVRLPGGVKAPHMGWNTISWESNSPGAGVFASLESGAHVYFAHSYHCVPAQPDVAIAATEYDGLRLCAGVARGNLLGLQFHPEKSGSKGLAILANWLRRAVGGADSPPPSGMEEHA